MPTIETPQAETGDAAGSVGPPIAQSPGTFRSASDPETQRSFHTATLLPDGRLLVVGGYGRFELLTQAEIYDALKDEWRPTGTLATARQTHSATLMPDGRVAIVGGVGPRDSPHRFLASIEIYDPITGQFSEFGTLRTPRASHAALALPDGRLLVIGGIGDAMPPPADIEVIDLSTGISTVLLANLPNELNFTSAVLLPDGRALLVGGGIAVAFDTDTQTLESLPLPEGLTAWPTAAIALLDGKVLVTGGCCDGVNTLSHAALFNPASGSALALGSMVSGRLNHRQTLLADGRVLITGGVKDAGHGYGEALASAELFNPKANLFTSTSPMSGPTLAHTATRLPDGSVLILGMQSTVGMTLAERYLP